MPDHHLLMQYSICQGAGLFACISCLPFPPNYSKCSYTKNYLRLVLQAGTCSKTQTHAVHQNCLHRSCYMCMNTNIDGHLSHLPHPHSTPTSSPHSLIHSPPSTRYHTPTTTGRCGCWQRFTTVAAAVWALLLQFH